jgi:hypothetical protein
LPLPYLPRRRRRDISPIIALLSIYYAMLMAYAATRHAAATPAAALMRAALRAARGDALIRADVYCHHAAG